MAGKADDKTASKKDDTKDDKKPADDTKTAADDASKKADDDTAADEKPAKKPEKTYTAAELKAATEKAAKDALEKAEKEKDLSELEKANNRIKELEESNRLRDAKDTFIDAAKKAGANNPELLWRAHKGDLEFDDKGSLKNLDAVITSAKTDFADQFGEPKPDEKIGGGEGQGDKVKGSGLTSAKLAAMSPQEINELPWEEVSKVMADGK